MALSVALVARNRRACDLTCDLRECALGRRDTGEFAYTLGLHRYDAQLVPRAQPVIKTQDRDEGSFDTSLPNPMLAVREWPEQSKAMRSRPELSVATQVHGFVISDKRCLQEAIAPVSCNDLLDFHLSLPGRVPFVSPSL